MSYQNLQYGLGDRKPSADEGYTSLMRDGQGDNTYATVDDAAKRQSRGSSIGSHGYVKMYAEGTGTGGANAGGAGAGAAAGAGGAALAGTAGLLAGSMADVRHGAFFLFLFYSGSLTLTRCVFFHQKGWQKYWSFLIHIIDPLEVQYTYIRIFDSHTYYFCRETSEEVSHLLLSPALRLIVVLRRMW